MELFGKCIVMATSYSKDVGGLLRKSTPTTTARVPDIAVIVFEPPETLLEHHFHAGVMQALYSMCLE